MELLRNIYKPAYPLATTTNVSFLEPGIRDIKECHNGSLFCRNKEWHKNGSVGRVHTKDKGKVTEYYRGMLHYHL